jgi:hypothetical protein
VIDEIEWYERLGNVPGVTYKGQPAVDRTKLPQHNAKPEVHSYEFDGRVHRSLSWKTREGSTSQSPAAGWRGGDDPRKTPSADLLHKVYEALELPGTVADYHFALLGTYDTLWARRKREPQLLPELEQLLLLDVALVEAHPDAISHEMQGEKFTPHVPAFHLLVSLYEREGFFHDALDIAKRGAGLGQGGDDVERLSERLAAVEAEDTA